MHIKLIVIDPVFDSQKDQRIPCEHKALSIPWRSFIDLLLANALALHQVTLCDIINENEELCKQVVADCLSLHVDPSIHEVNTKISKKRSFRNQISKIFACLTSSSCYYLRPALIQIILDSLCYLL